MGKERLTKRKYRNVGKVDQVIVINGQKYKEKFRGWWTI